MSRFDNSSAPVNGALKLISISLALLLLGVSCYHAGSFLWRTTEGNYQRVALACTVFGLLAASHCLSHFVGHAIKRGLVFVGLLCACTVIPIELFSIATSAASLDSRVINSVRRENQNSPEYAAAMRTVNNYQAQIESLRKSADNLPVTFVSKRESLHSKITQLQHQQDKAQDKANNINVSTTGAVYAGLERATSISAGDVSRIASIMLSVTPLSLGIAFAAVGGHTRREKNKAHNGKAEPGKKSARHLSAV